MDADNSLDKSAKNIPNVQKNICPKLFVQAKKFGILMNKGFIGRP